MGTPKARCHRLRPKNQQHRYARRKNEPRVSDTPGVRVYVSANTTRPPTKVDPDEMSLRDDDDSQR